MGARVPNPLRPVLRTLDPAVLRARRDGRSYWQVRYRDGHQIGEWEGGDWPLLPRHHQGSPLVACRLVCPNGQIGVVGSTADASDRLFQFKISRADQALALDARPTTRLPSSGEVITLPRFSSAYRAVAWVLTGQEGPTRRVEAQIIGLLHGTAGACTCYAWAFPGRLDGPFEDTFPALRYGGPATAALAAEPLGVRAD